MQIWSIELSITHLTRDISVSPSGIYVAFQESKIMELDVACTISYVMRKNHVCDSRLNLSWSSSFIETSSIGVDSLEFNPPFTQQLIVAIN